jgi:hypothetical protein
MIARMKGSVPLKGPNIPLKIECRVGVQAPAAILWEVLAGLDQWSDWTTIYPAAAGSLRIGGRLNLTLALPGEAHRLFEPVIIDWVPEEQILWKDLRWSGWVASTRFIEMEAVTPVACFLSNGEQFPGAVAEYYMKRNRRALKAGYMQFAEGAKARAEALWQERQQGAR